MMDGEGLVTKSLEGNFYERCIVPLFHIQDKIEGHFDRRGNVAIEIRYLLFCYNIRVCVETSGSTASRSSSSPSRRFQHAGAGDFHLGQQPKFSGVVTVTSLFL